MHSSSANPSNYELSSDLARLSLPQEYKDANRRLAWVNSICCVFLLIGIVGLKPPKIRIKPLTEVTDIVPVVITPPEEPPKPQTPEQPPEPDQTPEVTPDTPVVATVVAADPTAAAFAVPVQGPVVLAPTRFAAPPPRDLRPPNNKPVGLTSGQEDWGGTSNQPEYPAIARRQGHEYEGKVTLEIAFDAKGAVTDVRVQKSSGYTVLDESAVNKVKKDLRLRFPPGEPCVYLKEFTFRVH